MKLKLDSKYISKLTFNFPTDKISQDEKSQPKYFLECAKTILHKYVNNKCHFPYSNSESSRSVETLRAYAAGTNSPEKYKDLLVGQKNQGQRPKSTINISWDTIKILPQKLDVVKGYFQKMPMDTETSAIDYQSSVSKQAIIASLKLISNDSYQLKKQELNDLVGFDVAQNPEMPNGALTNQDMQFRNEKEVELFASLGGVFLEQEAAMINLLDKSQEESNWSNQYNQYIMDALSLGFVCGKVRQNISGTVAKSDYVDPEFLIFPNSKFDDFNDANWGGELKRVTIGKLRETTNLSNIKLVEIARKYATGDNGSMPNNFYGQASSFLTNSGFNENMIDQIEVDVVECRWTGTAEETYTTVNRKESNNLIFSKVDEKYEINNWNKKQGKEKKNYSRQVIYKTQLIVGTDEVFDYGIDEYVSYQRDTNGGLAAVFPYKAQRCSCLVDRCIPFVDDANSSLMKYRVAKKKMPAPPNLMIRKSALENVNINGVDFSPQQLLKLFEDEGFLIVDDENPWGESNGTATRAIDTIPNDVIRQLAEWRADIEYQKLMIVEVTGVNDIFAAQTPKAETGLGVSKLAIDATSNALFPIYTCLRDLILNIKIGCINKWKTIAKFLPKNEVEKLSIGRSLKYVKISSDLDVYDFGIKINIAPNEDLKLMLLQDIARLRDIRRQAGSGGITPSDYMFIWNIIMNGNIKQAQIVLAQIEEIRADEDEKREQQRIQENIMSQQASNQQTAENQAMLIQGEKDMDLRNLIEHEKAKAMFKIEENRQKIQEERKTAAIQNAYGWSNDSYTRKNA